MPFPASIALAVLKYRIKITENNKDDDDDYDENDLVLSRCWPQYLLEKRVSFIFVALLAAFILYRKISLKKCFGMKN